MPVTTFSHEQNSSSYLVHGVFCGAQFAWKGKLGFRHACAKAMSSCGRQTLSCCSAHQDPKCKFFVQTPLGQCHTTLMFWHSHPMVLSCLLFGQPLSWHSSGSNGVLCVTGLRPSDGPAMSHLWVATVPHPSIVGLTCLV